MNIDEAIDEAIDLKLAGYVSKIAEETAKPILNELQSLKELLKMPFGAKKHFKITEIAEITGRSRSAVHKDIKAEKLFAYSPEGTNNLYVATEEAIRYFNHYQSYNV